MTRITVSEFVALAAPNHGAGGTFSCGNENEPDRSTRQLCGGRTAGILSQAQPCGSCSPEPIPFTTNLAGDETFLNDLNGHDYRLNCSEQAIPCPEREAPRSRPTTPGGVLYVNLYAAGNEDLVVGGQTQSLDCLGRRLARNHAPETVQHGDHRHPGQRSQQLPPPLADDLRDAEDACDPCGAGKPGRGLPGAESTLRTRKAVERPGAREKGRLQGGPGCCYTLCDA